MSWNTIHYIQILHCDFLKQFLEASQFDVRPVSAIPSLIFLLFAFVLIHRILHRRSNPLTSLKLRFYREIGFQWSFFYITRVWFLSIKGVQWLTNWSETHLQFLHTEEKLLWLNHLQIRATLFSILMCVAMIPLGVVIMNCFWQHSIPNFLLWVGEDPWVRSEIGISGHYLDRPPNFAMPARKEYAYRSRRSISVEQACNPKLRQPVRQCKSLLVASCPNSFNTLVQ